MKRTLVPIILLGGATLASVSGVRLAHSVATLGELARHLPTARPDALTSAMPAHAIGGNIDSAKEITAPFPASDTGPELTTTAALREPGRVAILSQDDEESDRMPDPADAELRAALQTAISQDPEFAQLVNQSEPGLRESLQNLLQSAP